MLKITDCHAYNNLPLLELFKLNILPPRDIPVPVKVEYRETKFVIRMQQYFGAQHQKHSSTPTI